MKNFSRSMSKVISSKVTQKTPQQFAPTKLPKFCANLCCMFPNIPFHKRYQAARDLGFTAVESSFPSLEYHPLQLSRLVDSLDLHHVMINSYAGDPYKGEYGFAALPDRNDEFKHSIVRTLQYAEALGIKKINILAGVVEKKTETNYLTYGNNLLYAEEVLRSYDMIGLIEPIDRYSIPNYYLDSYDLAIDLLEKIDSPNLKLLLDIFHMQNIQGNISHSLPYIMPHVGHVQIAQVPYRDEPSTRNGELQYEHILDNISRAGYNDWIGLEYTPRRSAQVGMSWIRDCGYYL